MDTRQLIKGVLPVATLAIVERGDSYGYEILNQLRVAGLDTVGDASVYGTLQRLYDAGQLASYQVASESGPSRRYYSLTGRGITSLKEGRERWNRFHPAVTRLLAIETAS